MPVTFNPASFKDSEGHVFENGGIVYRTINPAARARMERLFGNGVLPRLINGGLVVGSQLIPAHEAGLKQQPPDTLVMRHDTVPVISYPYEWSFTMLKDAAGLALELTARLLREGLILKDATPFNFAYHQRRMCLIDVLSIDDYQGGPWPAYEQFCRLFLFPLFIAAYKNVNFRPWLRGRLEGIAVQDMKNLVGARDLLRRGVFTHVYLQSVLENQFQAENIGLQDEVVSASYSKTTLERFVAKLGRIVSDLRPPRLSSTWVRYTESNSYREQDESTKRAFVSAWADQEKPERFVDLGANTGTYSHIVAGHSGIAIAADADDGCIEQLYVDLKARGPHNIYPLICDLTDPAPAIGWRLAERQSVFDRMRSNGFLCLALVHHICIGGNVPVDEFVSLLERLGQTGVIEWVEKDDEEVRGLLRNRSDIFDEYCWDTFRTSLESQFEIVKITEIKNGHRKLCWVRRRDNPQPVRSGVAM